MLLTWWKPWKKLPSIIWFAHWHLCLDVISPLHIIEFQLLHQRAYPPPCWDMTMFQWLISQWEGDNLHEGGWGWQWLWLSRRHCECASVETGHTDSYQIIGESQSFCISLCLCRSTPASAHRQKDSSSKENFQFSQQSSSNHTHRTCLCNSDGPRHCEFKLSFNQDVFYSSDSKMFGLKLFGNIPEPTVILKFAVCNFMNFVLIKKGAVNHTLFLRIAFYSNMNFCQWTKFNNISDRHGECCNLPTIYR